MGLEPDAILEAMGISAAASIAAAQKALVAATEAAVQRLGELNDEPGTVRLQQIVGKLDEVLSR